MLRRKMRVNVRYFGLIRNELRKKGDEIELKEDALLAGLLDKLVKMYGEPLKKLFDVKTENILDPTFIVTVNGILTGQLQGMKTSLKEGDKVALMTLVSGG